MNILQAIELELPRRRFGSSVWDNPDEFAVYHVSDIVALDWEVALPNGHITSDFSFAKNGQQLDGSLRLLKGGFDGNNSGSCGSASGAVSLRTPLHKVSR